MVLLKKFSIETYIGSFINQLYYFKKEQMTNIDYKKIKSIKNIEIKRYTQSWDLKTDVQ